MSAQDYFAPVDKLLAGFEKVGIVLKPSTERTALYIWQTDGCAVYVGKKSDKAMRASQEDKWVKEATVLENYEVPFVRTMRRLNAKAIEYQIKSVDLCVLRKMIRLHEVTGFVHGISELENKQALSNAEIESALIRAIVQTGYVLANSTGAGQWDGPLRLPHLIGAVVAWALQSSEHDLFAGLPLEDLQDEILPSPSAMH